MSSFLHAVWFASSSHLDDDVDQYLRLLGSISGIGRYRAYTIVSGGADMRWVQNTVAHLDDHPLGERAPAAFAIAEVDAMGTALALASEFRTADGPVVDHQGEPYGVISQALFTEIADLPGTAGTAAENDLAPAVQLGMLGVKTTTDQWRLSEWYEYTRYPEVSVVPGSIRTRRYAAVAARARFAILYEFTSLEARLEGFETPMEGKFQDSTHPTAALGSYTVHAPGAPYIGTGYSWSTSHA